MIKIDIGNSYSKITGLTPFQEKQLREALSYVVGGKSAYYSGFGVKRRSLLTKKNEFPTGLLYRVYDVVTPDMVNDTRKKPVCLKKHSFQYEVIPYGAQFEALHRALEASRGIISMPTGTGKGLVIKMLLNAFNVKFLVIVPSLELKKQLSETLKDMPYVTVENIDSKRLSKLIDFDGLIIDEGHHVAAKTYQKLNKTVWSNIYHRFFLTATPFRNDEEETLLFEAIAGRVIYKLSYKDAVKNKYIVPVEAYYLEVAKQSTNAHSWSEVYSQLVVNNEARNDQITLLLLKLQASQSPTLCLVKEVRHGQILSDMTGLPFVSGADDASRDYIRQFNTGEIKGLIGTDGILSEGVDTKPCEFVVIAGLGKAKSQFMQKVGRAVRTYPGKESAKIILFRDVSHKFTLRHYKEQAKILISEYGVKPIKLEGI